MSHPITTTAKEGPQAPYPSYPNTRQGPTAHEDLTIAEQIETMRVAGEHRPGEECFLDSHTEKRWVPADKVQRFIRKSGAEHPSNYLAEHGRNWEEEFFNESNK